MICPNSEALMRHEIECEIEDRKIQDLEYRAEKDALFYKEDLEKLIKESRSYIELLEKFMEKNNIIKEIFDCREIDDIQNITFEDFLEEYKNKYVEENYDN